VNEKEYSILVVDDDDLVRELVATYLEREYSCDTASGAERALEKMVDNNYNILITDLVMPGGSALDLLEFVKEAQLDTIVIVMSGTVDEFIEWEVLNGGAFEYLRKPFDLSEIQVAVERALIYQAFYNDARLYEQWFGNGRAEEGIKFELAESGSPDAKAVGMSATAIVPAA